MSLPPPIVRARGQALRDGAVRDCDRAVPEETPIALVYDGSTEAVMMGTPADLEDFAVGFSLTEGIIGAPRDIRDLEVAVVEAGIELRLWLEPGRAEAMTARRRHRAGPVGCGLCGLESLVDAVRPPPQVSAGLSVTADALVAAMQALRDQQDLNRQTQAVHAAAAYIPGEGVVLVREDVGRHNALDKLAGALARGGRAASGSVILMTSRVSIELVQKAAMIGAPVLAAVSAPTALALRTADACGLTVAGIVRDDGLELFTHPHRVRMGSAADAA
jgi:FdhD protein